MHHGHKIFQICSKIILGWPLTFLHKGGIDSSLHAYGESIGESIFQAIWRQMYHIRRMYYINQ